MIIAQQKRKENIAEYLLYMWQVEDIVRACNFDIDRLWQTLISKFQVADNELSKIKTWYEDIINMMLQEGVKERGHLQINNNVLINLNELHSQLLNASKFTQYHQVYYKVLPYIVELRAKSTQNGQQSELQTCFEALYGVMLLRLAKKDVNADTAKAAENIATLLGMLAQYYNRAQSEDLFTEEQ